MIEQFYQTILLDDNSAASCLMVGGVEGCLTANIHRVLPGLHVWEHTLGDAVWDWFVGRFFSCGFFVGVLGLFYFVVNCHVLK